jgi:hypothetical protein
MRAPRKLADLKASGTSFTGGCIRVKKGRKSVLNRFNMAAGIRRGRFLGAIWFQLFSV